MARVVLLDTGPLGMVTHPRPNTDAVEWLQRLISTGASILIPEICDYELRRQLIRANRRKGIARLDALEQTLEYVAITTVVMRKAAELWAEARNRGVPTADAAALDGDMILCAQAATLPLAAEPPTIATTNVSHLALFADAQLWRSIR